MAWHVRILQTTVKYVGANNNQFSKYTISTNIAKLCIVPKSFQSWPGDQGGWVICKLKSCRNVMSWAVIRTVPLTFLTEGADLKHFVTCLYILYFYFQTYFGGSLTFDSRICCIFNEMKLLFAAHFLVMFVIFCKVFQWSMIVWAEFFVGKRTTDFHLRKCNWNPKLMMVGDWRYPKNAIKFKSRLESRNSKFGVPVSLSRMWHLRFLDRGSPRKALRKQLENSANPLGGHQNPSRPEILKLLVVTAINRKTP